MAFPHHRVPPTAHGGRPLQTRNHPLLETLPRARDLPSPSSSKRCVSLTSYRSINALMESFWSRVQVELLDQQSWNTRLELASAIFEYLEIFHNRQRRHSSSDM